MKNDLYTVDSRRYRNDDLIDLPFDLVKYKYALESSNIGIWDWNITTNEMYHSKESKAIFGYASHENDIDDTNWKARIHPDDLPLLVAKVEEHLNGNTPEYRSEHRIRCKNGSYKWILDCGKVVHYDELGNPSRFIGTTSDISERKNCEEEQLQNLNILSDRNNKLTNFAHIVTHNLKEYAGNFESLLTFYEEAPSETEKEELISLLKTVSSSLTKTIANLNEIVSKQLKKKIDCKYLNLNHFIENAINLLEMEIENKEATINNNLCKDLELFSNAAYLESITLNLLSNALKYSHPERKPVININSLKTNNSLKIIVSDNGIGIDLEKHGKTIFGLYNTFHGNENAEGVGLYITKNQIEALGGKISVKSTVNVGTTFTITIKRKKSGCV